MPEVEEPPQAVIPPPEVPKVPEPLKVKAGDRWREAFAKLEKEGREEPPTEVAPAPSSEPFVEAPKTEVTPEVKPAAETPKSPLDVITADTKPEIKPEPEEEFDEKNPDWKRAREVMKQQREQRKALESQLEELKKAPKPAPEEILSITQERDQLKDRIQKQEEALKAINYQATEEFQSLVKERDATVAKIDSRVKRYGGDSELLLTAMSLPDGKVKSQQIKEALSEVDPEDRTRIHTLLEKLDESNEKISEVSKVSATEWDKLQAKRDAEMAEQGAQTIKLLQTEFSKVVETLPSKVVTLRTVPEDVPEGSTWNTEVKSAIEGALRVVTPGGANAEESFEVAVKGMRYDTLEKRYLELHKDWVERGKRLHEYDKGGPDFKGGEKPKSDVKLTAAQKYHKALESLKSSPTE